MASIRKATNNLGVKETEKRDRKKREKRRDKDVI